MKWIWKLVIWKKKNKQVIWGCLKNKESPNYQYYCPSKSHFEKENKIPTHFKTMHRNSSQTGLFNNDEVTLKSVLANVSYIKFNIRNILKFHQLTVHPQMGKSTQNTEESFLTSIGGESDQLNSWFFHLFIYEN